MDFTILFFLSGFSQRLSFWSNLYKKLVPSNLLSITKIRNCVEGSIIFFANLFHKGENFCSSKPYWYFHGQNKIYLLMTVKTSCDLENSHFSFIVYINHSTFHISSTERFMTGSWIFSRLDKLFEENAEVL